MDVLDTLKSREWMQNDLRKKFDQDAKAQVHQLREESTQFGELCSFLSVVSAFYIFPGMHLFAFTCASWLVHMSCHQVINSYTAGV